LIKPQKIIVSKRFSILVGTIEVLPKIRAPPVVDK
jgi:hypothetical protein